MMKKYFFIVFIALQAFCTIAQNRNDKEPFMTKSFAKEPIKNVDVETSGGSIYVTGDDASESRVEVFIQQNNGKGNDLSKEDIQKKLNEDYELSIAVNNSKLTAIAKPKTRNINWKKALSISFKVFVPKNVSTELATSGGSIDLSNLSGKQNFTTSGGSLHINNLSGNIKGRTSGGSIHLANSQDEIDLHTSGGSIHAKNCSGNMTLETSGGSLQLSALKGNVKAHTSGGNVEGENISGELTAHTSGGNVDLNDLACSLETSTSGGNIDVSIKELGKYITINNSGGNIALQIPKDKGVDLKLYGNKIKTDNLTNFNGKSDDDEIKGTLNGGGIPVIVKSGSGKINLSFN